MGRRKKESPQAHRAAIAAAAERLFAQRGADAVTMDDIAAEAKYSKATLYVYFKNKEEIVSVLALDSMRMLLEQIRQGIRAGADTKEQYKNVCSALVCYQETYPFYFEMALSDLNVELERDGTPEEDKEAYEVGEQINKVLEGFLTEGMDRGALRRGLPIFETIFTLWGSISGLILLASKKERYFSKAAGMTKEAFLQYGFETVYQSIKKEGVS